MSVLQITLASLELGKILEATSRKVTTSGVSFIEITTIWSLSDQVIVSLASEVQM